MASWVESWSSRAWSGATAVAVGAPLLATLVTTGIVDAVLVAAALGAAIAAGWVVSVRRSLDALPVELAPQAAVGPVDGVRTVRVRFRLGRGRTMADVAVRVVFAPA
ncbi:MAG: hypothetical protein ABMB14_22270, partial [Myxococcota bacterium]